MVKIRLSRSGVKKNPFYKIVVTDERKAKGGRMLEIIGFWHPSKDKKSIDGEKIQEWISKGAQLTPAVKKLMD